ncbi:MAG: HypC/HybG/HupF family hydrogenase formation chaperone [Candidatus Omnitrophica bacterium]|nr:HypC/HybG/HupF family hydrogenase formation chaperone [Candidatus Omnitrophota bacterium]
MCLGIPMKVVSKKGDKAEVRSDKTARQIGIGLLKDIRVGDYVIVHAGFAIEKVDEKRAKETLDIIKEISL